MFQLIKYCIVYYSIDAYNKILCMPCHDLHGLKVLRLAF